METKVAPLGVKAIDQAGVATASWKTVPTTALHSQLPLKGERFQTFCLQFGNITTLTATLAITIDGVTGNVPMVTSDGAIVAKAGTITVVDGMQVFGTLPLGATDFTITAAGGSGNVELVLHSDATGLLAAYEKAAFVSGVPVAAGTNFIGAVGANLREVTITFTCPAATLAAGDVIADSQILAACMKQDDANGWLVGVQILDEDDQAAAQMDMYVLSANVTLGTEDAAISITDANARNIQGVIRFAATDWYDLIASKVAYKGAGSAPLPMPITPVSGSDDIYLALVTGGTPTTSASGITARLWFMDGL